MGSLCWVTAPTTWPAAVEELIKNPAAQMVFEGTGIVHALLHRNFDRWDGLVHPTGKRVPQPFVVSSGPLALEPHDGLGAAHEALVAIVCWQDELLLPPLGLVERTFICSFTSPISPCCISAHI